MTKKITNSELRTYKRCRRKWWLSFYRGLKLARGESKTSAASVGTRVHEALAAYYCESPVSPMTTIDAGINRDLTLLADDPVALGELNKQAELVRIMVEGYVDWLEETGADQGLKVVGVEEVVEAPFPGMDDVTVMGKLDLRVEREMDWAILFLDHKTVGSINQAAKGLSMNEQMMHYDLILYLRELEAGRVEGIEGRTVDGALYNMLRKVKRTARATPPFYSRHEVRFNPHQRRAYYRRVFGEVLDILETTRKLDEGQDPLLVAYPNPLDSCDWQCEYYPVCTMFDDGSDSERMLEDLYVVGDPNQRYADAVAEETGAEVVD